MNRTLGERIKLYTEGKKTSKWDEELDKLVLGINSAPHKVTKFSPFYLMHGYHARRKIDNELKAEEMTGELSRERLEKAQLEVYKEQIKTTRPANYKVGQLVVIERKGPDLERGKKLAQKWTGPFLVLKYEKGRVNVIPLEEGLKEANYNVEQTKPYYGKLNPSQEEYFSRLCKRFGVLFHENNDQDLPLKNESAISSAC